MSRTIKADDFAKLRVITDLDLAPQGDLIAFSVRRIDKDKRKAFSDLWWTHPDGRPRRLTFGDSSDVTPRFNPAGDAIAFLSNRADEKKLRFHLLPTEGGEAEPVGPELFGSVAAYEFAPDGGSVYYAFRAADEPTKGPEGQPEAPAVREIERLHYRTDGAGWRPADSFDIYRLDLGRGSVKQLTDDGYENDDFCLAPDGETLYYLSCHREDPDREAQYLSLFSLDLTAEDAEPVRLPVDEGPMYALTCGPGGRRLAWLGHEHPEDPAGRDIHLCIYDLETGEKADLTGSLGYVGGTVIDDLNGICPTAAPRWSPCGRFIFFQLTEKGTTSLWQIDLEGERTPRPVIRRSGAVTFFRVNEKGLAYGWVEAVNPGEVYWYDWQGRPRKVTSLNTRYIGAWDLPEPERVWFDNGEGLKLQGWILKPPDFNPAESHPAILEVHGGPHVCYGEALMHEFHYLAGRGYVVFYTNPRGGTSYGEDFTRAIVNDWGNHDYHDVMAALDYLQALPYVDAERCGITGGSYGGYMTNWVIGHSDRFRAAVTQRSVSNLVDFFGASDAGYWFEKEFGRKFPWVDLEHYWKMSPLNSMAEVDTPTLVIHSEGDLRCPVSQGEQVYVALKIHGVPTKLVRFPEESHGLSRGGRPDRRVKRLEAIADWFDEYLNND
ncbi:MAG: prolyl oligopeptidase family serine peptidase [Candidatus Coatesbacteria bacterium]|nr:prolyl oligopeptidase family serine peptidase [Candidatus Coatesbacteria bacterium]